MPGPHDFAVRSDLTKRLDRPCAACRSFSEGVEAPFVRAPVVRSQTKARPAIADRARRCRVHRIPPRVRDDRDPPLFRVRRDELVEMICPTGIADYFASEDWTSQITLESFGKIAAHKNAHAYLEFGAGRRESRPRWIES